MKKLYTLLSIILISTTSQAQVVISQIYGGGGNAGAVYTNDFIELFNRGSVSQSLAGWSVQYASANGTTWTTTALPNVSLQPGQYFLIQQAAGTNVVLALPTPDLDGMSAATTGTNGSPQLTGIAMSGSNGKVILSNSIVAETTADPSGSQIMDKVAFGTSSTSGFEGTGPTGTALTNGTAALRNSSGCTDTNNNASNFSVGTPTPRNTATALNICTPASSASFSGIEGFSMYPNPLKGNTLNFTSTANGSKSVQIFDVVGKEVVKTTTTNNVVNVANLNAGVYIVKVTEEGKTATRKLVVQ